MSDSHNTVSLSILGKIYKVKCPAEKIAELRESAQYLEDKMRKLSQSAKIQGADRLAVIAALNVSHELLMEKKLTTYMDAMNRRIRDLQNKIDESLARSE
jgi:cell division protein ZapA